MNNKLEDIVLELNQEFYEDAIAKMGEKIDIHTPFEYHSNGYCETILFFGVNMWDSENNNRFDENDKEIDLKDFILKEVKQIVAQINCFKL